MAINSVLQQDYPHWELLLIDDGSTDNSSDIAKSFALKYPNKIIYSEHDSHANKGLSASRNHAIKKASGEFVAFLDGDDVWLPNLLSQLLGLIKQHGAGMVCEASKYWYSWDNSENKDIYIPVGSKQDQLYFPPQLIINLYPLGEGDAPCPCGILVKKDVLMKHGGFDESFKGMYEDQVFLIKFYLHECVYISSGCHNQYRQRQGSLVNISYVSGKYLQERKLFLDWLEQYFKKNRLNQPEVKSLLDRALFPYRYPRLHFVLFDLLNKGKKVFQKISRLVN